MHLPCSHAQRIQFARTKSDAVAKIDGSYKPSKNERSKKNAVARGAPASWVFVMKVVSTASLMSSHGTCVDQLLKRGKERATLGLPVSAIQFI
jgi:hypothetical protein